MKKSTMLIVLLGVLMFGLVGNLFGQTELDWGGGNEFDEDLYYGQDVFIQAVIHIRIEGSGGNIVPVSGIQVRIYSNEGDWVQTSDANGDIFFMDMVNYVSDYNLADKFYLSLEPDYFFDYCPYYPSTDYLTWQNNYTGTIMLTRVN